ncbi:MAG: Ig-like domain-containing protein [Pseudomonadota bacterium]
MMFDAAAAVVARDAIVADSAGQTTRDAAESHHAPPSARDTTDAFSQRTAADGGALVRGFAVADTGPAEFSQPAARDVIFIDTSVADYRQLASEWAARGDVVLIDATKDGIDQVRTALAGRSDIAAIHIVGHGSAGVLELGTTRIDRAAITGELATSLGAIGRALGAGGDILIYGCDFASGAAGADALAVFAQATHADVAASTDTTGHAARGGNWDLESRDGAVETSALASRDWVHTLDPNTPVPIAVTADSLTVRNGTGTIVTTGATGYGTDARSPDVGAGATATWAGAAVFNGRSVDLRATVVSISAGDMVRFNRPTGTGANGDDPTFLLRDLTAGASDATVQIRWELIDSLTGNPLPADVRFTIADIDGIGGNPNTRESVTASTAGLAYYTRERITDINFTPTLSAITASGTQNENLVAGDPVTPQSAATFDWSAVSAFTLTYKLTTNATTTQAQFFHDGDADFIYTDPVYVSVPRLDLDADDSSAAGNDALATFTENGPRISIVDTDLIVANPMPSEGITGATVRLTNWQTGDNFQVEALPAGLTASIGAVTGGTQTITFSGTGSESDYTAALQAISFANSSDTPNTTQRVVEITFSNDTLTSATALSRINVIPVNDAPVRIGTLPTRITTDAATVSYPTAGAFSDPEGDVLSYSATGLPAGLAINAATGVITGTINRSASQTGGGVYTVVVTARDPSNAAQTQGFTITVANPPPVAVNDAATTLAEDTSATIAVLANDSDPDGDPLTVTAASALNGTVVRNGNGTLTYTPNANYNGPDTISYTIADGQGGTANATAAITVTPVNDAPGAVGSLPPRTGVDGGAASFGTAAGFSDIDGDTLVYTATGLPAGLAIDPATGVISGTLDRSASQPGGGSYTVVVTARDPANATRTQSFTYTVTNPPPVAQNDSAATSEDTPVTIAVLGNDSDPDSDPLTVTAASALHGTVVRNGDGTLNYTPNPDYSGSDTISYTIGDGHGGTANATVAVTIAPVNDAPGQVGTLPPRATSDAATVNYPTAAGFGDPEGDTLAYSATGLPAGLAIDAATGVISGTLDRSASQVGGGAYAVVVTARDPANAAQTQGFTITVANPPPVAVDDPLTTLAEDTSATIAVLPNDSDPDGDPLTVTAASALNGTVVRNGNGTLTYTPNANYSGSDTISYTIADGHGGTASASAAITVTPVNDAPQAVAIPPAYGSTDGSVVFAPIAEVFADPDGDALSYAASGLPAGLAIDPATGNITGTVGRSASQLNGGVYSVTLSATDPGGLTATQTITVIITNPPPVATNDSATTPEDTPITIAVLLNDSDPDGDPLDITAATALHGSVAVNPDGTLTYTPNPDYNGTDTISYIVSDGEGGTANAAVAVTVTPANDAPDPVGALPARGGVDGGTVAFPTAGGFADRDGDALTYSAAGLPAGLTIDPASGIVSGRIDRSASQPNGGGYIVTVTARDASGATASQSFTFTVANPAPMASDDRATTRPATPVTVAVLGNDSDSDGDPLNVTAASAANGTVAINPDGTLTYTPDASFTGTDTLTYTIGDGEGGSASAVVRIDVINTPPAGGAIPDVAALDGQIVSLPIAGRFSDPDGDPLSYSATGLPPGLSIDPATGTITGTIGRSASQATGGYASVITASDGRGGTSSITLNWTIANPAPVAHPDLRTVPEDTQALIFVLANDSDPDGDPLTVIAASAGRGSVTIGPAGGLIYTPDRDYTGPDTISYTIDDSEGGRASASVAITVTPINDAPTTVGLPPLEMADSADVAVPLASAFGDPEGGTLSYAATGLPPGLTLDSGTGTITGTIVAGSANGGPAGDGRYPVTVIATDPGGLGVSTGFVFTVAQGAPAPADDRVTTTEDTPVAIPVLANDTDPDADPLTIISAGVTDGSVTISGNALLFIPAPDFSGPAIITYTVADPAGNRATATVTVDVTPADDAPTARPVPAQASRDGQPVALALAPFFSDRDGDAIGFAATGLPPGLAIDPATGRITGTIDPAASQIAGGIFRVTVTGTANGLGTSASFDWVVANPPPVALNDTARTSEDTPVTIAVLSNDSDPDGDPLRIVGASAGHGTVSIGSDGRLTYTPGPDFAGSDAILYTIGDGNGGLASAVVTVTVDPVNDAPVVPTDGVVQAVGGQPVAVAVLPDVSDAEGDPLTITGATAANGVVSVDPAGVITFTPELGFTGSTTITFTVADGNGGTAIGTLVVQVAPRTADIEQLLRIGRVSFIDPPAPLATIMLSDGLVRNPIGLLDAAEGIRSLNTTRIGDRPVIDAVNAARGLNGTFIDAAAPVAGEVRRLDQYVDRRDAGDRLFDQRWSDFFVKGLTGFSAAADRDAGIMVESVVRGGAIYLEVRDIATDGRAEIRNVQILTATGGPAPEWISVDTRGLAIIERAADMDELHLIVRVTRENGRTTSTPIVVQGATGEIELDRPTLGQAQPLDRTLQTPRAAQHAAAERLARNFR